MFKFKNNMQKKDVILFVSAFGIAVLLFIFDLLTKNIIINNIEWGGKINVIDDFFCISHVHNTGAAWGIFSDKTTILSIATLFASLFVIYLIYASTNNKVVMLCFTAILGGAAGNLSERIFRGYVTDFLSFNIFGYDFPSFNLADICITVGCFLLVIYLIFIHKKEKTLFRKGTLASRIWSEDNEK